MRKRFITFIFLVLAILGLVISPLGTHTSRALGGANFKPGRIIDDAIFYNKNSMSAQQIQDFLNAKVPICETNHAGFTGLSGTVYSPPFTCLKEYQENPDTHENNIGRPTYQVPGGKTAAQIIWQAAQDYGINPQVLIVVMQKETGIVSDTWAASWQYKITMGYACPDSSPTCDSNYYGFYNQVVSAAWQFRQYTSFPNKFNFKAAVTRYIQYNPETKCGGSNVYLENQATANLYNYTPYQPNSAALAVMNDSTQGGEVYCGAYGNRNFFWYFNTWFGSTTVPLAFKSPTSATVYYYIGGYKVIVPYMGLLQDYGISPETIQTISQNAVDSIPPPPQDDIFGKKISPLVKSLSDSDEDGGSIYLVSRGIKYHIKSMLQFNSFGFKEDDISYFPMGFLNSIQGTKDLSNYIQTPYNSVFQVENGQKRIIFNYATYIGLNPSDDASALSYFTADLIRSGTPISSSPVLLKRPVGESVVLYANGNYYGIPDFGSYSCWGFDSTLKIPVYRIPQDNYISDINTTTSVACRVSVDPQQSYLLNGTFKYSLPATYNIGPQANTPQDLRQLIDTLPTKNSLKQYVKPNDGTGVWYITNGIRKPIPSYSNYLLLGLDESKIDIVTSSSIANIPIQGIKLAPGQLVKASDSPAVYVIDTDGSRILYTSSNDFIAYKNDWGAIETYNPSDLDNDYPYRGTVVKPYLYDRASDKVYLVDQYGCYSFDDTSLQAYNKNKIGVADGQTYSSTIFSSLALSSCKPISTYVRTPDQSLVYSINNGKKTPITTWAKLVSQTGQTNPYVPVMSRNFLDSLPLNTTP